MKTHVPRPLSAGRCFWCSLICLSIYISRETRLRASVVLLPIKATRICHSWWFYGRPLSKSKLPERVVKDLIEFCELELPASPCKSDVRRRWVKHKTYVSHATHFIYGTKKAAFDKFKEKYSEHAISYTAFKRNLPWWVVKGKRETCLCGCCENMSLLFKALTDQHELIHQACAEVGQCTDEPEESAAPNDNADAIDEDGDVEMGEIKKDVEGGAQEEGGSHCDLCRLTTLTRKRDLVAACPRCPAASSTDACRSGECDKCGFRRHWLWIRDVIVKDETVQVSDKKSRVESSLRVEDLTPQARKLWSKPVPKSRSESK